MKRAILFMLLFSGCARAALQTQAGQFTANTGATTTVVNCNFQGKAIIFFSHAKAGNAESATAAWTVGASDGTHHHEIGWVGDDAVATTNVGRGNHNTFPLVIFSNGAPTIPLGGSMSGVSFGASTFTVTFQNAPSTAWLIGFILLGGTDITNVLVGQDSMPTATGTTSFTSVGFKGDFIFMFTSQQAATSDIATTQNCIGAAVSATKRWSYGWTVQDAQTLTANVNGQTIMRSDRAIVCQSASNSVNVLADFVQFTSTGFDLNFTTAPGSGFFLHWIVIQGGQWDAGTSVKPTTATTQTVTGETFRPSLLGLFTSSPTASNGNVSNAVTSMGASDGTNQVYAEAFHNDAINTVANSAGSNSAVLLDRDGTNNPSAAFTSFNSDGWTVTWNQTGSAREVSWFTAASSSGFVSQPSVIVP